MHVAEKPNTLVLDLLLRNIAGGYAALNGGEIKRERTDNGTDYAVNLPTRHAVSAGRTVFTTVRFRGCPQSQHPVAALELDVTDLSGQRRVLRTEYQRGSKLRELIRSLEDQQRLPRSLFDSATMFLGHYKI